MIEYLLETANIFEWLCFLVSLWFIRYGWLLWRDAIEAYRDQLVAEINGARLMVAKQNVRSTRLILLMQALVLVVWLSLLFTPPAVRLTVGINQAISGVASLLTTLILAYLASSIYASNNEVIGYLTEHPYKD